MEEDYNMMLDAGILQVLYPQMTGDYVLDAPVFIGLMDSIQQLNIEKCT